MAGLLVARPFADRVILHGGDQYIGDINLLVLLLRIGARNHPALILAELLVSVKLVWIWGAFQFGGE